MQSSLARLAVEDFCIKQVRDTINKFNKSLDTCINKYSALLSKSKTKTYSKLESIKTSSLYGLEKLVSSFINMQHTCNSKSDILPYLIAVINNTSSLREEIKIKTLSCKETSATKYDIYVSKMERRWERMDEMIHKPDLSQTIKVKMFGFMEESFTLEEWIKSNNADLHDLLQGAYTALGWVNLFESIETKFHSIKNDSDTEIYTYIRETEARVVQEVSDYLQPTIETFVNFLCNFQVREHKIFHEFKETLQSCFNIAFEIEIETPDDAHDEATARLLELYERQDELNEEDEVIARSSLEFLGYSITDTSTKHLLNKFANDVLGVFNYVRKHQTSLE